MRSTKVYHCLNGHKNVSPFFNARNCLIEYSCVIIYTTRTASVGKDDTDSCDVKDIQYL